MVDSSVLSPDLLLIGSDRVRDIEVPDALAVLFLRRPQVVC